MSDWDAPLDLEAAMQTWAAGVAQDVLAGVIATAPVSDGPLGGQFQNSLDATPQPDGVDIDSSLIGRFLVQGTRDHDIWGNPLLAFYWPGAPGIKRPDQFFIGPHVHHPGTGPHDFLERAIDAGEVAWTEALGDAIAAEWSNA